jgi:hypothetical protein
MAIQDDRDRMAAINDATRTPMMQAVLGGPTNKRSQLQKQVAAERPVDAMTGAATKIPRPPVVAGPGAAPTSQRSLSYAAGQAAGFVADRARENLGAIDAVASNLSADAVARQRTGQAEADSIRARAAEQRRRAGIDFRAGMSGAEPDYTNPDARRPGRPLTGVPLANAGGQTEVADIASLRPATNAAPAATPFREGNVGLEDPAKLAAIAAEQKAAGEQAIAADAPRARVRGAVSDQARAQDFVAGNKAPRSDALSINRPIPIPGSDMQYGGQYGDTAVIERPGANGERSFSDTSGVAGANPAMGGIARPGAAAPVQPAGEQLSPAEQFIRNTTMSDGTRAFGGSGSEQLHRARLDALARGDGEAVTRSQMTTAERAEYDRRNQAYAQDPLKAYEIDQVTAAENAKADAASMRNYRQDLLQQAGLGLRQSAAETAAGKATASARNASLTQANNIVKTLFPDEPEAGGILGAILEQAVASGNSASLNQLAATEAAKLRAAMSRDDFDPASYMAQYIGDSAPGSDFSAMDDIVPNL